MGNTIEMDSSLTDVAYNPADDEYFVVFDCDCFGEGMGLAGVEIFGQRLDSNADGIGVEVRISNAGANTPGMSGRDPAIAFNTSESEYLTVWKANDAINKYEVFGQRLSPAGDQIGTNDFQISFSGAADDPDFNAGPPDVTYNSPNNEFLVVWSGDDDEGGLVDEEMEVFGQRVDGSFDAPADLINSNFRLSDINGIGTSDGFPPVVALAFNSTDNISLVIWSGTDDVPPLVAGEFEIFGQLLTDPECGNGLIEADEACDDGNTADDDGCSASCTEESSGTTGGGTTGGETTGTGSTGGTTGGSDSGGGCSLIR
jgi:cysteine-rich repeat protein